MTKIHQSYNLSVVSGGKPTLPNSNNSSCSKKTVTCLTPDQANYIVPFNNQIKIYSIDTRQCIKTVKYANNEILSKIFKDVNNLISYIALGDITVEDRGKWDPNKMITILTTKGNVVVLNYKGKLSQDLVTYKLSFEKSGEEILKMFEDKSQNFFKLLTKSPMEKDDSLFHYKLYNFYPSKQESERLVLDRQFENVILSTWSSNEKMLTVMTRKDSKTKMFYVQSIFDVSVNVEFPLSKFVTTSKDKKSSTYTSPIARYVSAMAIDDNGLQLALGFASGVIHVIALDVLQTRILKWHIDTVLSLSFNQDGTYLLSGGWEKVLIFWQLSTNMQQFLPRLNGIIIDSDVVCNNKYYALTLQLTENTSNSDYQLLLLNSSDLISKLSINGPLPVFHSTVKDTIPPLSAFSTKNSTAGNKINSLKKNKGKNIHRTKQDYTTCADINPISKQIYFPHVSSIQAYDFYKNEQVSYQYLSSAVNNSMGKVRSELNIKEPVLMNVKFTKNGTWMITYEVEYPPDNLLSSKELTHVIKFWSKNDDPSSTEWFLKTKVINPHGKSVPITNILASPSVVNNGNAFLTSDNMGGLKYWSFEEYEKNWCLTKLLIGNFNLFNNSVSMAWSKDGSLIFHSFYDKLIILDFDSFKKIESEDDSKFINEFTLDSEIQAIKMSQESKLIIATRTTICILDLLESKIISSFDIYPYVKGIYKNGNFNRLLSCNENTGEIALVINEQLKDDNGENSLRYRSRVIVFNSTLTDKLGVLTHNEYISWIGWNYSNDFVFIDTSSRLGTVSTAVKTEMLDEINREGIFDGLSNSFATELQKLSKAANSSVFIENNKKNAKNIEDDDDEDIALDFINGQKSDKIINMNTFIGMFDNLQNVEMDAFFDRVTRIIT
ncbi:hypothetical protein TBLA_0B04120 [Henningerozyma blattae CBS 6284]|uniref:Uncharacterized protein n=1 Tax=Henningerozyma blattae (strain ATCC 34711 / CBS 6284 / DSM 70876 / NBRC 10599 / NRRL Y-10934 / UCD 77-7) TaxID=1071380 RepID=I2GYP8_HENB6|nr:hypothetical protein TBLA_0B04120 [Tetrapisispora blattae CBS 6284]CCH59250.1 hypothetical protein TBLA_0B04120 [Tetrapisispora blattae CBS 6284]